MFEEPKPAAKRAVDDMKAQKARFTSKSRFLDGCAYFRLLFLVVASAAIFLVSSSAQAASGPAQPADLNQSLSQLEIRFFANDHDDQANDARLERLEKFIFGETKDGTVQQRLDTLLKAIPAPPLPAAASNVPPETGPRNEKQISPAATDQEARTQPPPNSSDYPTVSKLETLIIGNSFAGEPIQKRLDRLEIKAFGQPSDSDDLTARVDRLKSYTGLQTPFSEDEYVPPAVANRYANPEGVASGGGILQNVFQLEQNVFGRSYAKKAMIDRVSTLERAVFPAEQETTGLSLPERIDRLMAAVGEERSLSGYPPEPKPRSAPDFPSANPPISNPAPAPVTANNNAPAATPNRSGRSFLRGLGKALGLAGQVALGALGGGYSSSYMMSGSSFGMGSAFGGFSPGFGIGLGGIGF